MWTCRWILWLAEVFDLVHKAFGFLTFYEVEVLKSDPDVGQGAEYQVDHVEYGEDYRCSQLHAFGRRGIRLRLYTVHGRYKRYDIQRDHRNIRQDACNHGQYEDKAERAPPFSGYEVERTHEGFEHAEVLERTYYERKRETDDNVEERREQYEPGQYGQRGCHGCHGYEDHGDYKVCHQEHYTEHYRGAEVHEEGLAYAIPHFVYGDLVTSLFAVERNVAVDGGERHDAGYHIEYAGKRYLQPERCRHHMISLRHGVGQR